MRRVTHRNCPLHPAARVPTHLHVPFQATVDPKRMSQMECEEAMQAWTLQLHDSPRGVIARKLVLQTSSHALVSQLRAGLFGP